MAGGCATRVQREQFGGLIPLVWLISEVNAETNRPIAHTHAQKFSSKAHQSLTLTSLCFYSPWPPPPRAPFSLPNLLRPRAFLCSQFPPRALLSKSPPRSSPSHLAAPKSHSPILLPLLCRSWAASTSFTMDPSSPRFIPLLTRASSEREAAPYSGGIHGQEAAPTKPPPPTGTLKRRLPPPTCRKVPRPPTCRTPC